MLIIPVIDLSGGLVVHAKQGLRQSYQPVTSVITTSSEPDKVLASFLELYPFKIIYIADLDSIQNTGSNAELIVELAFQYKQCEFWLDAGIEIIRKKQSPYLTDNIKLILGSEKKLSEQSFIKLLNDNPDLLLSLDFDETGLIENHFLLQTPSIWPEKVIIMMLNRVGSNKGFDSKRLNEIINLNKSREFYAAGGVKDRRDLVELRDSGVNGVLLATALHNGSITKKDLRLFYTI